MTRRRPRATRHRLLMAQELMAFNEWGPANIDARQHGLNRLAFEIWQHPGEVLSHEGLVDTTTDDADDPSASTNCRTSLSSPAFCRDRAAAAACAPPESGRHDMPGDSELRSEIDWRSPAGRANRLRPSAAV